MLHKAQSPKVTLSGLIKDAKSKAVLPFVNITLKTVKDSTFVAGTISGEDGRFILARYQQRQLFTDMFICRLPVKQHSQYW